MSLITDYAKRLFQPNKKAGNVSGIKSFVPFSTAVSKLGVQDLAFFQAIDYYNRISIISTCIDLIAESFSQLTPQIVDKQDNVIYNTEVDALLAKPNDDMGWSAFAQAFASFYLITGNSFLVATGNPSFAPSKLYVVKPTDVSISNNSYYVDKFGTFARDAARKYISNTGMSELFHTKRFSPNIRTDDITVGQSKLQSLYGEIELFEYGYLFNHSLLKNGARPSGVVLSSDTFNPEQYERLREQMTACYSGASNAGKIMFFDSLGQNASFQTLTVSANDMQFMELNKDCVNRICNRLQVPLPLVIADASTYNNVENSVLFLYDNAVFPLADILFDELSRFLINRYPKLKALGCRICYDKEEVGAIKARTVETISKKASTGLFTTNELRREAGYEDIDGGDLLTGSSPQSGMYDVFQGVLGDATV